MTPISLHHPFLVVVVAKPRGLRRGLQRPSRLPLLRVRELRALLVQRREHDQRPDGPILESARNSSRAAGPRSRCPGSSARRPRALTTTPLPSLVMCGCLAFPTAASGTSLFPRSGQPESSTGLIRRRGQHLVDTVPDHRRLPGCTANGQLGTEAMTTSMPSLRTPEAVPHPPPVLANGPSRQQRTPGGSGSAICRPAFLAPGRTGTRLPG